MNTVLDRITLFLDSTKSITVKGFIEPIEYTLSNFHEEWDALANLRVAEPEKNHPLSVFHSFIPIESVSVGECWEIEKSGVKKLLQQLHPNPNLDMHLDSGDSQGLWACLRACNQRFADIQFRIHVEFKLKDGWFTPSKFIGNLIIDRLEEEITFFKMYVPEGTVNFDVNWKEDQNEPYSITDAGLIQRMELRAGTQENSQDIEYALHITEDEATRILNTQFYKSEQINWVRPEQAVELAEAHNKLIHVISVDGPLADEAC